MKTVGIDPGKNGALVIIDDGQIIDQRRIPLNENNDVDLKRLCSMIQMISYLMPINTWCLEEPHAIMGTSKGSMWTMGRVLGNIEAALTCNGVNIHYVRPKVWQKLVWIESDKVYKDPNAKRKVTDTKATSLNAAMRIFPEHNNWLCESDEQPGRKTKPHDGIVDAALIAYWGQIINS